MCPMHLCSMTGLMSDTIVLLTNLKTPQPMNGLCVGEQFLFSIFINILFLCSFIFITKKDLLFNILVKLSTEHRTTEKISNK